MTNIPQGFELVTDSSPLPEGFELVEQDLGPIPNLIGAGEAALSIGASSILQPFAGLYGIAKGGSGDAVRDVQSLAYQPRTKEGQKSLDWVSGIFNAPIEAAGKAGEYLAGNEGRLIGEVGSELAMNLVPIGIVGKGLTGSKSKGTTPKNRLDALEADIKPQVPAGFEIVDPQMELDLATTPQQIAEVRARETGTRDMFGPVNEPIAQVNPAADTSPMNPVNPMETTAQAALFDQDSQGRMANPYEAATGDWRIDENGIPVKVDLSMEAQNVQNPLQRNLWGDELEPTMSPVGQGLQGVDDLSSQMGTPLTQAIDSMPWAQKRGAINKELRGSVDATGELQSAIAEANSPFPVPQSQRGALNMDMFDPAFKVMKELENGIKLVIKGSTKGPVVFAVNPAGKIVGEASMSHDTWARPPKQTDNLETGWVTTDPNKITSNPDSTRLGPTVKSEYPGLATEMYKFVAEQGNDIVASKAQTPDGKRMWEGFENRGISVGLKIPKSQRGAIDLGNATEKADKRIRGLTLQSPEVIAAKQTLDADKRRSVASGIVGLSPYKDNFDTPEKVIAAAPAAKDITNAQLQRGKTVTPGINAVALSTDNPLVKYVRKLTRSVFQETEGLARQYITGKDGLKPVLYKMNQAEKNDAIAILQLGDRNLTEITRAQMESKGFSEKTIDFVERVYAMEKVKLAEWNAARAKVGLEPVTERPGHFPGVFNGDYKQIVYGLNPDGSKKVIGLIAVDTTYQLKKAQAKIKEQYPDATYGTVDRRALGGNGRRSDMFSGMNDVVDLLARTDPEFAKVQEIVSAAVKERADALFGASVHSLAKKGVFGSEGQKPWKGIDENTNDMIKAYLRYWEEGILSHKNLVFEAELKGLMDNPALDNMPNAKNYVNEYVSNMTGRSLGTVGDAINKLLDAPFKLVGLGPSVPRELVNQINKRAGQWTMGWGNFMFSAVQFLQIPQMMVPEMTRIAGRAGISVADPGASLGKVAANLPNYINEAFFGKSDLDPLQKQAVKEAEKRGILQFSEFQDVNKVTQSKASRIFDTAVDINRSVAEQSTRPFAFFATVEMLRGKVPDADLFDIAYNATQRGMIDYSLQERPMMYQRLGVVGQLAGSLQTFKHGMMSQMTQLVGDMGKGEIVPAVAAIATLAAFAGIKGTPFYEEADQLVKYLTDKFGGNRQSIREAFLSNMPEWLKSGVLSTATDVNLQSRLSAADVLPNSIPEAVTPYASLAGRIGESVGNVIDKSGSPQAVKNLAINLTPSGPLKGLAESALATNEQGIPIDKKAELGNPRTEWESNVRKYSGGLSLSEALRGEVQYDQVMRQMANQKAQSKIMERAKFEFAQGRLTEEQTDKFVKQYIARKGDPSQFINSMVEYAKTVKLTKQQRLEGIPSGSLSSLYRYQNFNETND